METTKKPSKEKLQEWRDNPDNWKLGGLIYYNKEDKRLLPPKQIAGFGWTVNFANPYSILTVAGITFLIIVIVNWLTSLLK